MSSLFIVVCSPKGTLARAVNFPDHINIFPSWESALEFASQDGRPAAIYRALAGVGRADLIGPPALFAGARRPGGADAEPSSAEIGLDTFLAIACGALRYERTGLLIGARSCRDSDFDGTALELSAALDELPEATRAAGLPAGDAAARAAGLPAGDAAPRAGFKPYLFQSADATAYPPIAIRGKKGAGKDTLAAEIRALLPAYSVRKWASKLREAAEIVSDVPADRTASEEDKRVDLSGRLYAPGDLLARLFSAAAHVLGDRSVSVVAVGTMYLILTREAPPVCLMLHLAAAISCVSAGHSVPPEVLREVAPRLGYGALTVSIPMTVGRLLQVLGTDCFRDFVGPDVWVDSLMGSWEAAACPPALFADTRFPNELAAVHSAGGVDILVRRTLAARADGRAVEHPSECALDDTPADFVFDNDGSFADLRVKFARAWPAILALAAARRQ